MTTYDTALSIAQERHDAEHAASQAADAAAPTPQDIRDAEDRVDRMLPGDPVFWWCACEDNRHTARADGGAFWATAGDATAEARRDWQGHIPTRVHLVTQTTTASPIPAVA